MKAANTWVTGANGGKWGRGQQLHAMVYKQLFSIDNGETIEIFSKKWHNQNSFLEWKLKWWGRDQTGKVGEDSWEAIRRCQGEMMN